MTLALGMTSLGAQGQQPVLRVYDEPCLVDAVHEYVTVTLPLEVLAQNRPWNTQANFIPPSGHGFGRYPRADFAGNPADAGLCPDAGFGTPPPAVTAFVEALAVRGQNLQGRCPFPFQGRRYGRYVDNGNNCGPDNGDDAASVCIVPTNRAAFSIVTQRDLIQFDSIRTFIIANGKAPQCIRPVSASFAADLQTITDGFVRALDQILRPVTAPGNSAPPASPN
jgi:hypothetical protein